MGSNNTGQTTLSVTVIRRLMLARYLHQLSESNLKLARDIPLFACLNLLQDAVESFLLAAVLHFNLKVERRASFDQLLDAVQGALSGDILPHRTTLVEMNKARVGTKHDGIRPDFVEIERYYLTAGEFFTDATRLIFQTDFRTISLIELIEDNEPRAYLEQANAALKLEDYEKCLVDCRKAFYVVFERSYDVIDFDTDDPPKGFLATARYSAPVFARNRLYIQEHVKEPFDYIVLDHGAVTQDLLKLGISATMFWNVWRLTPETYRRKDESWLHKNDLGKLKTEGIESRAAYVLESMIEILLKRQDEHRRQKLAPSELYAIGLLRDEVSVYRKADRTSEPIFTTPKGVLEVFVSSASPGLNDRSNYWQIFYTKKGGPFIMGFVEEKFIDVAKGPRAVQKIDLS